MTSRKARRRRGLNSFTRTASIFERNVAPSNAAAANQRRNFTTTSGADAGRDTQGARTATAQRLQGQEARKWSLMATIVTKKIFRLYFQKWC